VTISATGGSVAPTYPVVVSNNLLKNPGIQKGVKYWNGTGYAPAQATFDLDSMAMVPGNHWLKGVVTTSGANPWEAQFTQSGFALGSGKQYEVRLKAKADVPGRPISVSLINALTYSWYGGATLTLSDAWKEYTFRVVPNQNAVGSFNIDIGAQAGTYYLDDLSLVDLSPQVGVETQAGPNVPDVPTLEQNFPNPFNPSTTLRYGLPRRSHVLLTVHNTLGQQIAVLQEGEQEAGYHEVVVDASGLASGVYLYRLQAGDFVQAKKLVLLR